jgi:polysaccharide biosynthesis protein PslH
MKTRPKLLFLAQVLPFPPDSGVAIRTYHVLRLLARHFDVTALCFYRARAQGVAEGGVDRSLAALSRFARVEAFPIPQEHSRVRLLLDHARSAAARRAYTVYAYRSAAYRRRLEQILRTERFDLVHLDSLDLADYLPLLARLPVVCVHHNVESRLLRRRSEGESSGWRRRYLAHQAELLEREERRWCSRIVLNVTVSEDDRSALERVAGGGRFIVVPNGVDVTEFTPDPGANDSVAYIGGTEWFPNVDALEFFGEQILPLIGNGDGPPAVRWVGRASPEEQRAYADRFGVELTGYVPDVRPYLRDAACAVVPLRIGGGTRLKITTAWAMGKAVVSTSVGCEGLAAVEGENILIRDSAPAFAAAVVEVLHDDSLRERLGRGARRTAEERYSWEVIGEMMIEAYRGVLERAGADA